MPRRITGIWPRHLPVIRLAPYVGVVTATAENLAATVIAAALGPNRVISAAAFLLPRIRRAASSCGDFRYHQTDQPIGHPRDHPHNIPLLSFVLVRLLRARQARRRESGEAVHPAGRASEAMSP